MVVLDSPGLDGRETGLLLANLTGGGGPGPGYTLPWEMGTDGNRTLLNGTYGNFSLADLLGSGESGFFDIYTRVVLIVLYAAVFLGCTVGNLLVIIVVLWDEKMRTTTNFFLANLAVADLSVGFFCILPNLNYYFSPYWLLGKVMCKLLHFVRVMSYSASIIILTIISIERYFVIVHPLKCKEQHPLYLRRLVVIAVWSAAAICGIPRLIFYDVVYVPHLAADGTTEQHAFCVTVVWYNKEAYVLTNFLLWYIIPVLLITLVYSRISVVLWQSSVPGGSGSGLSTSGSGTPGHRVSTRGTQFRDKSQTHVLLEMKGSVGNAELNDGASHRPEAERYGPGSEGTEKAMLCYTQSGTRVMSAGDQDVASADSVDLNNCCILITKTRRKMAPPPWSRDGRQRLCTASCSSAHQMELQPVSTHAQSTKLVHFRSEDNAKRTLLARRRVVRLLIVLIACFALCVAPYHVLMLWHHWWPSDYQHLTVRGQLIAAQVIFLVFYLNSALNPLLYALFSDNFRRSLRDLLHRRTSGFVAPRNTVRRSTMTSKTNNTTA